MTDMTSEEEEIRFLRIALIEDTMSIFKEVLKRCCGRKYRMKQRGSLCHSLWTKDSDVDFIVIPDTCHKDMSSWSFDRFARAVVASQDLLGDHNIFLEIKSHRPCRYTYEVISSMNPEVWITVDLEFSILKVSLTDSFINDHIREDPEIRNFLISVKDWGRKNGVINPHGGGLSSYALVLVAIHVYAILKRSSSIDHVVMTLASLTRENTLSVYDGVFLSRDEEFNCFIHITLPRGIPGNAAYSVTEKYWMAKIQPLIDTLPTMQVANPLHI